MNNISEIIAKGIPVEQQAKPQGLTIDEFAGHNINEIFKELCSIFPAWRNHMKTQEEFNAVRASFAKGMIENGITSMDQVKTGLAVARKQESDFFPSVGKFIGWCSNPITPVDVDFAFRYLHQYLAGFRSGIPDTILAAFDQIGKSKLRTGSAIEIRRMFEYTYKIARKHEAAGNDIKVLITAPPAKKRTAKKLKPEFVKAKKQRALDRISVLKKDLFGANNQKSKR